MNYNEKVSAKKIAQIFISSAALGIALLLAIWIIDYFNVELKLVALTNINWFLNAHWMIVVGFVLFIGLWQYLSPFYKKYLTYFQPLVDSIEILFGLWLIVVFLDGLRVFNTSTQAEFFMKFPADLFFNQFVIVVLLVILVKYSQYFLVSNKREDYE